MLSLLRIAEIFEMFLHYFMNSIYIIKSEVHPG